MRTHAILLVIVLTTLSCAARRDGSTPDTSYELPVTITGGAGQRSSTRMVIDRGPDSRVINAPIERVWTSLHALYDTLAIPVGYMDQSTWEMGSPPYEPRRIEGKRLSLYMDCGSGHGVTSFADSYKVTLAVHTRLVPQGTHSTLMEMTIEAIARPRGGLGNAENCVSTGWMIRRSAELLREWLGAGG